MKTATYMPPAGAHANHVSLNIQPGYATIVLQNLSNASKQFLDRELWVALSECKNKEVRSVCLWVIGDPPNGSTPSPPLPIWAKASGLSSSIEAQYGQTRGDTRPETEEHLPTMDLLRRMPQQVVGFGEGSIGSWGTLVLSACQKVIATRATEFRPLEDHNSRDNASGNWDLLVRHMTMEAKKAHEVGFVAKLVDTTEALAQECSLLHRPGVIKTMMQPEPSQVHSCRPAFLSNPSKLSPASVMNDVNVGSTRSLAFPPAGLLGQFDLEPWKVEIREPSSNPGSGKEESHATSSTTSPSVDASEEKDSSENSEEGAKKKDKKDLFSEYLNHDGPITTLMICNLPCRITYKQLVEVIEEAGFKDKYDFLNLPTGGRSAAMRAANLGYGFINFVDPSDARAFYSVFSEYQFDGTYSEKACSVRPAHLQGLSNNLRHMPRKQRSRRQGLPAAEATPKEECV